MTRRVPLLPALLACLTLVAAGCGSSDSSSDSSGSSSDGSSSAAPSGPCTYQADGQAARDVTPPSATPSVKGAARITLDTKYGAMPIRLDARKAPCAVNALLSLTEQKYFDGTVCHRIAAGPGFHILQCGDPTGSGSGSPGYRYAEELSGDETYGPGVIAMANAGSPGSTGSQFFVNFGNSQLPPQYTVVGKLTPAGLAVAKKAAKAGLKGKPSQYDGAPATEIRLTKVTEG